MFGSLRVRKMTGFKLLSMRQLAFSHRDDSFSAIWECLVVLHKHRGRWQRSCKRYLADLSDFGDCGGTARLDGLRIGQAVGSISSLAPFGHGRRQVQLSQSASSLRRAIRQPRASLLGARANRRLRLKGWCCTRQTDQPSLVSGPTRRRPTELRTENQTPLRLIIWAFALASAPELWLRFFSTFAATQSR